MKILCLYNNQCALELFYWLRIQGHETILQNRPLDEAWCNEHHFDLTVSYTYRYILTAEVLDALGNNAVNLHNSFLPWNRGADPNIWSILNGTPRGVTLHYMDAALDKGSIIAQKLVPLEGQATLQSSYDDLDRAAKELFRETLAVYPFWQDMRKQALGKGDYHASRDGEQIKRVISTWDMPVSEFIEKVKAMQ